MSLSNKRDSCAFGGDSELLGGLLACWIGGGWGI